MKKPFTHHDDWFYVFDNKDPHWPYDKRIVRLDNYTFGHEWIYHYIAKENKMFRIAPKDTYTYRRKYNGGWHVSSQFLTEIPIPPEWQHFIDEYKIIRRKEIEKKNVKETKEASKDKQTHRQNRRLASDKVKAEARPEMPDLWGI